MKKLTASALFFMSAAFTYTYASDAYLDESDMRYDVSLLTQSSLLYQNTMEQRMYDNTKMVCRGIKHKYKNSTSKTARMEEWMSKVELICKGYD